MEVTVAIAPGEEKYRLPVCVAKRDVLLCRPVLPFDLRESLGQSATAEFSNLRAGGTMFVHEGCGHRTQNRTIEYGVCAQSTHTYVSRCPVSADGQLGRQVRARFQCARFFVCRSEFTSKCLFVKRNVRTATSTPVWLGANVISPTQRPFVAKSRNLPVHRTRRLTAFMLVAALRACSRRRIWHGSWVRSPARSVPTRSKQHSRPIRKRSLPRKRLRGSTPDLIASVSDRSPLTIVNCRRS